MPGKITAKDPNFCKRCGNLNATITARQDRFCTECYTRFITTKIIKRMESFRVGNISKDSKPRRILLALSLGISSLALLYVLDKQIERQRGRTGQAGFELCVCWVDEVEAEESVGGVEGEGEADVLRRGRKRRRRWEKIQERYQQHQFVEKKISDDVSQHQNGHNADVDTNKSHDAAHNLSHSSTSPQTQPSPPSPLNLSALLPTLPSTTSHADISSIRLLRTLTSTAASQHCEAIVFGHTTTALAQKILAETAKGRGFAIPWLVNDGPSPYFGLEFRYPMRDLFGGEVERFVEVVGVLDEEFASDEDNGAKEAASGNSNVRKADATIDGLMADYFRSVEENYPSIVANVVKTSGKLSVQGNALHGSECELCGIPVPDGRFGIHGWGGYDEQAGDGEEVVERLCYGCARSLVGAVR